ncbi:MAG: DUF2442 domain-containing protein [Ignavibacteriae bacterium]|nr:DUF2442 domain-containing protein [Ignavibacteriota bacterium]
MIHPIYKILSFKIQEPYTLQIVFDDKTVKTINFSSILIGEMYGPLKNLSLFNQVKIDPEVHTLVWPNGADFDPATLYDWNQNHSEILSRISLNEQVTA